MMSCHSCSGLIRRDHKPIVWSSRHFHLHCWKSLDPHDKVLIASIENHYRSKTR